VATLVYTGPITKDTSGPLNFLSIDTNGVVSAVQREYYTIILQDPIINFRSAPFVTLDIEGNYIINYSTLVIGLDQTQPIQTELIAASSARSGQVSGIQSFQTEALTGNKITAAQVANIDSTDLQLIQAAALKSGPLAERQLAQTSSITIPSNRTASIIAAQGLQLAAGEATYVLPNQVIGFTDPSPPVVDVNYVIHYSTEELNQIFDCNVSQSQSLQQQVVNAQIVLSAEVAQSQASQLHQITAGYTAVELRQVQGAQREAISAASSKTATCAQTQLAQEQSASEYIAPHQHIPVGILFDAIAVPIVFEAVATEVVFSAEPIQVAFDEEEQEA
jgi:hypothetical protein